MRSGVSREAFTSSGVASNFGMVSSRRSPFARRLKEAIPEIIEIAHVYVNFEDEIEKIKSGKIDKRQLAKPKLEE